MELFEVEQQKPRWKELQEQHNISCTHTLEDDPESPWMAETDPGKACVIGDSERDAVITLIHRMKLAGWESVSIEA